MTCERALHAWYRRNRTRRNRTRGSEEGVQACGVHLAASQCLASLSYIPTYVVKGVWESGLCCPHTQHVLGTILCTLHFGSRQIFCAE